MDTNYNFPVELQPIYLGSKKEISNRKAVVRTDTEAVLGVVSNEYELVRHATVIDAFREAGKKYDIQEKVSLAQNGAYLFYQMTFPKVEAEVTKGDIVRMQMVARNSYNSMSSLQIVFGALRLVCTNGMVLGTKFMQFFYRHIGEVGGLNSEVTLSLYRETYKKYIKLFGEKMPLITTMAKKELPAGDGLFDKEKVMLPKYLLDEAKVSFEGSKDHTVWGYYNSLTFAISHKMKKESPNLTLGYGMEAWKVVERLVN